MRAPLGQERRLAVVPGDREEPLVVSRHEAARLLGVGQTTVDGMIRAKLLRSVRIARRRLVVRASIFDYISHADDTP